MPEEAYQTSCKRTTHIDSYTEFCPVVMSGSDLLSPRARPTENTRDKQEHPHVKHAPHTLEPSV